MRRLHSAQLLDRENYEWKLEQESSRRTRKNDDGSFEAILAKVAIEGESMVEPMMVDQSKAGAIDEAKVFVIILNENRRRRLFNRFANTKIFDAGPAEGLHEFDGRLVTDFQANQCVGLGENKIGGKELSLGLKQLRINRFCDGMVLVVRISQGKKCTRIQKYFQGYRYR
jgi:hypothetical protein